MYVPPGISPARLARMRGLGAEVTVTGGDAAQAARAHAASHPGCVLANNHPALAEGAGAIGVELLRAIRLDAVVLPVSDGTLVSGVGRWVRARSPATRIIGVCPATAAPAPEAVRRMRQLVDDMVLVPGSALLDAMRLAARALGVLIEPSAAAGLAAIAGHDVPGTTLATVLTGTDPGSPGLAEALGDGLPGRT